MDPQEVIDVYMLSIIVRFPGQYNTKSNILLLCFDLSFIKFFINTREKQELPGVGPGTSGLLSLDVPLSHIPHTCIYSKYSIYISYIVPVIDLLPSN